jgi:hypothetical protein
MIEQVALKLSDRIEPQSPNSNAAQVHADVLVEDVDGNTDRLGCIFATESQTRDLSDER